MGIWTGCIYGTKGLTFSVLSVYQTVKNTHHGPASVYLQQVAALLKEGRGVTPRKAFSQDLTTVKKVLQRQKIQVIISGDFNSKVTLQNILQLMNNTCNLELVSDPEAISSTYRLGKNCIDHVLASSSIASNISSIEYLEYPDEYYINHTPIMITLQLNKPTRIPPS